MPVLWVKDILEISAQVWEGHDYVPLALAQAPRSIRFSTAEINHESIHIAEELGSREVARFTYMAGPVGEGTEGNEEALSELLGFTHRYAKEHGYMEFRAMVSTERLVQALSQHGLSCEPDFRYVLVYEYPLP